MAAKKENKIVLERTFNIPLRREFMKVPEYKRAKKAMKGVRDFLEQHMKSDNVKLGRHLNMAVWTRGIRHPPHHIKVVAKKDEEGVVKAELFGAKEDAPIVPLKPKKKSKVEDVLEEKVKEVKEEKAAEAKVVEHEEIREMQHEGAKKKPRGKEGVVQNVEMHPQAPQGRTEMRKP